MRFATLHFPHQIALVLFLVLLLAVAFGCSKPPQPKTEASTGTSLPQQSAPDKAKSGTGDAALAEKVKTALASDADLRAAKIDVDANSGVVTLKGRVDSDDAKKRLQEVAQRVQGVTWVQNQVSVGPKAS
jgi:osmotically-inducible protein OsmY